MRWLKITLLMWAVLGARASAGELADAKNSFDRWMGCGYSDGYHASKCYRRSHCSCACLPTARITLETRPEQSARVTSAPPTGFRAATRPTMRTI